MFKIPNSVPGFRFHPSDVQLLMYFLKRKVMGKKFPLEVITELDIYQYSPWDLPDKSCLRSGDLEWFFFSPRGKKYCSGSRTNRATNTGYWKSTGKDRAVPHNKKIVGKIKTLVFHTGKSPDGKRTNWVIHEYRLEDKDLTNQGIRQDSYVICKVFQKQGIGPRNGAQYGKPFNDQDWNDDDDDDDDVEKEIPLAAAVPILNMTSNISSPQSEQHLPAPASGCIEPTSMSTLSGPVLSPEQHLPAPASGCIEPTSMSTLSGPVLSPVSGCIEPTSMSTLSGPVLSPVSGCIEPTSMSTLSGPELSPVSGCIEPTSMSTLSGPVLSSDAASPSDPGNQDVINDDDDILTLLDLSTELEEENKLPEENIVKGEPPSDFFEGLGDLDDWAALSGLFYDKNNAANSSITKEMVTSCDMDFMELIELDSPLFCQETTPPN